MPQSIQSLAAKRRKLCGVKKAPGTIWNQVRLLLLVGVLQQRTDKNKTRHFRGSASKNIPIYWIHSNGCSCE